MKHYLYIFCLLLILSACTSSSFKTVRSKDYILHYPVNLQAGQTDLLYVITATGAVKSTERDVGYWLQNIQNDDLAVAAVIDWNQNKLLRVLNDLVAKYNFDKVFVTGFSNGGYNSCYFGLNNSDLVDAIIPMEAYCSAGDLDGEMKRKLPILSIVGEKDTWARGNDLLAIDDANVELQKLGLKQESIIISGLGHTYPVSRLRNALNWLQSYK